MAMDLEGLFPRWHRVSCPWAFTVVRSNSNC